LVSIYKSSFGLNRLSHSVVFIIFQAAIVHIAQSAVKDLALAIKGEEKFRQVSSVLSFPKFHLMTGSIFSVFLG
jgi:hypothetical protein